MGLTSVHAFCPGSKPQAGRPTSGFYASKTGQSSNKHNPRSSFCPCPSLNQGMNILIFIIRARISEERRAWRLPGAWAPPRETLRAHTGHSASRLVKVSIGFPRPQDRARRQEALAPSRALVG
eukprot:2390912-Prymnesium_polylepis.1